MKILLLLLLLIAPPAPLKVGDVVYAHTAAGLMLRKTAGKDGAKLATLASNAAPLRVLALPDPNAVVVAETYGSFTLPGGWLKVGTRDGKEGYVFSGYVSRYPPMLEAPEQGLDVMDWFYRTISPPKGKRVKLPNTGGSVERYRQLYADGTQFESILYNGGMSQILDLPADTFTMQEALVLFRTAWFGDDKKTTGTYENGELTIQGGEGYLALKLKTVKGRLRAEFMSAD
jgi:hypothetical protein